MPPMTASSCLSCPTSRFVNSKRFITLALCAPIAPDGFVVVMTISRCEYFATGEQRGKNECDGRLRCHGLLDRPVDDEFKLVLPRDRNVLDRQRIEHRAHGLEHQRLAEIELAERAALRHEDQSRD